jgi:hypothetical protein
VSGAGDHVSSLVDAIGEQDVVESDTAAAVLAHAVIVEQQGAAVADQLARLVAVAVTIRDELTALSYYASQTRPAP